MNMETLQEAYRQLQRDYIKAQNKLQDLWFELEWAMNDDTGKKDYDCMARMVKIMGRE